jgi:predicted nucleotidyltransferase
MRKEVSQEQLTQLTSRIVEASNPESVILFGSQAKGNATSSSDYDIALIFSDRERVKPGLKEAHRALWPRQVPIDLVGFTQETFQAGRTAFAREVRREGKSLYQKHEH